MLALLIPGVGMGGGQAAVLVEVPDVVGETEAAGTLELETALFVVSVTTAYSASVAAGLIVSQDPVGGSFASEGSTVEIVVSLGPEPVADEPVGGHYWPSPADQKKKRKDHRPELDEKRVREKQELRDLIARAAGLLDAAEEAESAVEPIRSAPRPEYRSQVAALRVELDKLSAEALDPEPVNLELHAQAVERIVAMATDDLVIRVAGMLEDLIQEIADDAT